MPEKLNEQRYIIPLPPSGIPAKCRRLIKEIRETTGSVHVNMYQTKKTFSIQVGKESYREMNCWMEVSADPLEIRSDPDWPVRGVVPRW